MNDESDDEEKVGYRRPPVSTRWRKGESGNWKGRQPGRRREIPYETVLGQTVTIRENGEETRVTAAQAFLLYMTQQGLERSSAATRKTALAIEEARAERQSRGKDTKVRVVYVVRAPGSVNKALQPLRMARKLDRYRETARMALEPWIVEAALARLGEKRLTRAEQREVYRATRTPKKVRWPDWWEVGEPGESAPSRRTGQRSGKAKANVRKGTRGS